ncbi:MULTISPECIES: S41 family peptidase [Heyndrickxia]|jgi:carboxyl-terminal processing protease|uniref:C-terminal processing peptidase n=1 Tax=Heyndrickxia coagulans TaxID=1398 RepID=A0A133KU15_HEYCO|nr:MULTISPECIES: S41 family peptidase [Heyndrickxia]KWZ82992.1 peptidase, S41 family [Heyndrickxia coagulans]MEC2305851.1 S41 family peptidase [Weizmannia sp. CD-2023]MEC2342233.1 S41 family peptidase [Weizmannia sp. CD-2023]MED4311297.1 S41 family peptidase [Heyndrickxia coagulans]MED4967881.1 S41 family peptidase [Heyndrickxia coagulans]
MKRKWLALAISGSLLAGAGGGYTAGQWFSQKDKAAPARQETTGGTSNMPDLTKIAQAYQLIKSSYVRKVDEKTLVEGAIKGMVSTLDDPYSVYMDKETAAQFNDTLDSSFQGIGAEITKKNGKILIVSPYRNSPAEKAGLRPEDVITTINGKSTAGMDLYEVTTRIRGKKGSNVKLGISRAGSGKQMTVTVKRDEIPLDTVYSKMKKANGKKIGYIGITQFSTDTATDFAQQLEKLENRGMEGLVIDVRGNPGGLLSSVEAILKQFVTRNKPYLQIEERSGHRVQYVSKLKKKKAYPVAVLVDKGSASASEIMAAALHETENYPLIGARTFGKGTVQEAVPMEDESIIKLTMFKWLTPDGHWIHHKGIAPTIEVKQPDYFDAQALQISRMLKKDMNNAQIKTAQQMLKSLGFSPGREDGYFDIQTENAVKAFQFDKGLPVTGSINQKTADELEKSLYKMARAEKNDLQLQVALKVVSK